MRSTKSRIVGARLAYIYGLVDPRDGKVRYVGKADDPQKRLKSHLREKDRKNKRKLLWIEELAELGLKPSITYLQEVGPEDWGENETFQIEFFRSRGLADLNIAPGGEGGMDHGEAIRQTWSNPETRERNAEAQRKVWSDPRYRQRMAELHRRENLSPEARKNMSEGGKGKIVSAETRRKLCELHKGKMHSTEHNRKVAEAARRNWADPEFREKRVAALREASRRPETKRKKSEARLGKHHTEEARKKMSESHLRRRLAQKMEYG